MGAGRRTETAQVNSALFDPQIVMKRGLSKEELGAVIFHCNNDTMGECLSRNLLGLPRAHFDYVKNVEQGMPLFLFNIDDRRLYGIFRATDSGSRCFNRCPEAWSLASSKMSRFPAQVPVVLERHCVPLEEHALWRHISYFAKNRFLNELTKQEAHCLLRLFGVTTPTQRPKLPAVAPVVAAPAPAASSASVPRNTVLKPGVSWSQVAGTSAAAPVASQPAPNVAESVPLNRSETVQPRKKRWGDDDSDSDIDLKELLNNLTSEPKEAMLQSAVGTALITEDTSANISALREQMQQLMSPIIRSSSQQFQC